MSALSALVIDNSPAIHRLVQEWLDKEGVKVHLAGDGAAGLAAARKLRPDLILLEVNLPVQDGFTVCRQLKSDPETSDLPVIFLTASATTQEKIRGLDLGAVDFIAKPFEPAEFRARVRAALRTKQLLDLLAEKAQIDGLTGLRNRRYLDERLAAHTSLLRRGGQGFCVLMCDLDHFKTLNDTWGHSFGDEVLRAVATTFRATCREEDIPCRYGGEEICVLAPGVGVDGAAQLATRLREAVADLSLKCDGTKVPVTISIGVAEATRDAPDTVLRRADAALYEAKQAGRNRVAVAGAVGAACAVLDESGTLAA